MAIFGDNSEIGKLSVQSVQHVMAGIRAQTGATGGTLDSIWFYGDESSTNNARNVKAVIYDDSGNLVAESNVYNSVTTTTAWHELTFTTPPSISATTHYVLVIWADGGAGGLQVYYNNSGSGDSVEESVTYGTAPDPIPGGWDNTAQGREYAVYGEYTETSTGPDITDANTDNIIAQGENALITGTNLPDGTGSSAYTISPTNDVNDVNAVVQTGVTYTSATSSTIASFNYTGTGIAEGGTGFLFATDSAGTSNAAGFQITRQAKSISLIRLYYDKLIG